MILASLSTSIIFLLICKILNHTFIQLNKKVVFLLHYSRYFDTSLSFFFLTCRVLGLRQSKRFILTWNYCETLTTTQTSNPCNMLVFIQKILTCLRLINPTPDGRMGMQSSRNSLASIRKIGNNQIHIIDNWFGLINRDWTAATAVPFLCLHIAFFHFGKSYFN